MNGQMCANCRYSEDSVYKVICKLSDRSRCNTDWCERFKYKDNINSEDVSTVENPVEVKSCDRQ